jgi:isopentenyl-diphosphate delta-isomerase
MHRAQDEQQKLLTKAFSNWGIPTADVITNAIAINPTIPIIASGGLRSGVDIAKCIALGARLGGMAGPFLKTAVQSVEETIKMIKLLEAEIRICMFASGSKTLEDLRQGKLEIK